MTDDDDDDNDNDNDNDKISFLRNEGSGTKYCSKKRSYECSCGSRSSFRRRRSRESYQSPLEIIIKILTASYGPCEYNSTDDSDDSPIPSTRDCASFLLDLLVTARWREGPNLRDDEQEQEQHQRQQQDRDKRNNIVRFPPTVDGKIQSFVYLLPGVGKNSQDFLRPSSSSSNGGREFVSMNAVFGDPCPGKTKRLEVRYTVTEVFTKDSGFRMLSSSRSSSSPPSSPPLLPYDPTEIHRVSFAEHETVKLRRCLTTIINTLTTIGEVKGFKKDAPWEHGRGDGSDYCAYCSRTFENKLSWQLQPATSEIVLPVILPFLDLWERMQCRSICRCWKKIVQECGVSRTIDVNNTDITSAERSATAAASIATSTSKSTNSNIFTRNMLRGLLARSYSSLQSLFLSGFGELQKKDLHPALRSLQNLHVLDISHCICLDNSTLQLLAQSNIPVSTSLRVLYLKGLLKITDIGLKAICSSCSQLEVLDLSHLTNITDEGGRCIQRLICLRALFLRNNWQLTNDSIDAITTSCFKLEQLTLWGCIKLRHLKFDDCNRNGIVNARTTTRNRLVILNLWGCYGLEDDAAHVLSSIPNLNCLIVSECHRLTDRFIQILVEGTEQQKRGEGGLHHLHLRYLKRITDAAVVAIALKLRDLLSLDLTFCSKVTATGIYRLLDELRDSLVELRLKSCRGLQIGARTLEGDGHRRIPGRQSVSSTNINNNHAGHWVLNALRRRPHSRIDHSLCLLDVRKCGGQPGTNLPYTEEDPFVKGMHALQFEQKVPGFFSRSV